MTKEGSMVGWRGQEGREQGESGAGLNGAEAGEYG